MFLDREWFLGFIARNRPEWSLLEQKQAMDKYLAGVPVDYILGQVEVLGYSLRVDQRVLIPRPETEWLLDKWLKKGLPEFLYESEVLLDIGTGSGLIGLCLSKFYRQVLATDISPEALVVAKQNARLNKVDNIDFFESDILSDEGLRNRLTEVNFVLVANLPYVPISDIKLKKEKNIEYEPEMAIFGGLDGLEVFNKLLLHIQKFNLKPAAMVFELDPRNIHLALEKLELIGFKAQIIKDLDNFSRFIICQS